MAHSKEHRPVPPVGHQWWKDKALPHLSWVELENVSKGQYGKSRCRSSRNKILPVGQLQGRFTALCNRRWLIPSV